MQWNDAWGEEPEALRKYQAILAAIAHCDGDGASEGDCFDCPMGDEVCCTGDGPPSAKRVLKAADAAIEALMRRLDHALSWPGVEEFIDRVYPAEVFDGSSGNPGPRLLAMLRRAQQAEADREKAQRRLMVCEQKLGYAEKLQGEAEAELAARPVQVVFERVPVDESADELVAVLRERDELEEMLRLAYGHREWSDHWYHVWRESLRRRVREQTWVLTNPSSTDSRRRSVRWRTNASPNWRPRTSGCGSAGTASV